MNDPNFPPSLDIHPLVLTDANHTLDTQQDDIVQYGIAGRVWEASKPLIEYFTPDHHHFDPPCPILQPRTSPLRLLELGSGQALATLHLAQYLRPSDTLVLTDLDNVVPLCLQSVQRWEQSHNNGPEIAVKPLAWEGNVTAVQALGPFDFIVLCDLIYFPHLYPPLLCTLLQLTESAAPSTEASFGPTILLSYHSRTLALEEAFFDALGQYFQINPVIGVNGSKMYLCRRWRITDEWIMPKEKEVMSGAKGIVRGRDFGFIDELFASLDYS